MFMAQTDRRKPSKLSELPRLMIWVVGVFAVLMLINSAWTYKNISKIVEDAQHRTYSELAKGLALAVNEPLVTRNYGSLETSLQQVLINTNILKASVADAQGKILASLKRNGNNTVILNFDDIKMQVPVGIGTEPYLIDDGEHTDVWQAVNQGVLVGWVYLDISDQVSDQILSTLRRDAFISTGVLFLLALGIFSSGLLRTVRRIRAREFSLQKQNDDLASVVNLDPLTKLPNRRMFEISLQRAVVISEVDHTLVAVCFLDLDGFKSINDELGHKVGDVVLIKIAERLKSMLREYDTVLRLGGDEFVLILAGFKSQEEIKTLLDRVIRAVNAPIQLDDVSRHVGASIGVAVCADKIYDANTLLSKADQAMYEAKREGRNRSKFCE